MYVFGSRTRKSKMLCLPALEPVANDAHDVGDSGEWLVSRR
jgi:hypothetical protein